jgi:maltokinase
MRADLDAILAASSVDLQPVHGDLHVGQVLEWSGGLAVIDFDGNPTLGPAGNALRQPAERDVAQMLSSLDHLGRVVDQRTAGAARPIVDAWIARTRQEFLAEVDPDQRLLAAFEVEQECRELVYAGRFLPRWRYAPLATLRARYDR